MNCTFWALLAAIFAGATAVLAKVGVSGVDSNLATAIRTTVILVFTWLIALTAAKPAAFAALTGRTWIFLILSGLTTALSWLCYFRALQLGQVAQVAPIDQLSLVFAIAFAALFLGEPVTPRTLLGGALIVSGAIVLAWKA